MPLVLRILRLAIPSIATFSSMTFTGLLILMTVGRLGAGAIAVVGISNILMYNMWALFAGLQGAINYLVAQHHGSQTMRLGNQLMQISLITCGIISILVFISSLVFPHLILRGMGANKTILTLGTPYVRVRMIAFMFTIFSTVFYAYMRAIGDTRTPMIISLINSGLVVSLTYLFCYGKLGFPHLGLQGAAWSMVCAEGVAFLLNVLVYFRFLNDTYFTRTWVAIQAQQVRLLLKESAKLSVLELSNSLGMMVFTSCITRLGTVAVAANEIALNVLSFGFMPANGFGAASTIGIGQEIGKGQPAAAKRFGIWTTLLGLTFMALVSTILFLFALPIAKLYTSDSAVYTVSLALIHLAAFIQMFNAAGIIFSGGLRGVGDTNFLSRVAFLYNWALFIPGTLLLTQVFHLGQVGAWTALCSLMILTGITYSSRYLFMNWSNAKMKSAATGPESAMHIQA